MAVLIPILLVFIAGGLVALQAPTNAMLAKAGELKRPFDDLMFFATCAETFLQHLQSVYQYLFDIDAPVGEADGILRPGAQRLRGIGKGQVELVLVAVMATAIFGTTVGQDPLQHDVGDAVGQGQHFERGLAQTLRDLLVVKKSGRKVPFSRDKLLRSMEIAVSTCSRVTIARRSNPSPADEQAAATRRRTRHSSGRLLAPGERRR